MITLGQQRLIELTKGHPLAVERLRQMNAVIEAARAVAFGDYDEDDPKFYGALNALAEALREGGWLG